MNNIEIYTAQMCTYCHKAKKLLKMLGFEYTEHDVSNSFDSMCEDLSKKFDKDVASVPQIIINGKYVGGYDDLEKLVKSDEIKSYLN